MTEQLVRGTTPTIRIKFSKVEVSEIEVAYLVFKWGENTILTKGLDDAIVGENYLEWIIAQEESVTFPLHSVVRIMCDWKTVSGTRGRSYEQRYDIIEPGVDEVI